MKAFRRIGLFELLRLGERRAVRLGVALTCIPLALTALASARYDLATWQTDSRPVIP